jgi:hypothetical protein
MDVNNALNIVTNNTLPKKERDKAMLSLISHLSSSYRSIISTLAALTFKDENTLVHETNLFKICSNIFTRLSNQLMYFKFMKDVDCLDIPPQWFDDKRFKIPDENCKKNALFVISILIDSFDMIPIRVAPSIENGIYIKYQLNKTLEIEIYNDSKISGIVSHDDKTLLAMDIIDFDFKPLIDQFNCFSIS